MDVKHTHGPWMKSTHGGISKYSIWSSSGQHIADTNTTKSIGFERCAANACLIAAAPELLEVAQLILAEDLLDFLPEEYVSRVRAAIAKATGESQ